MATLLPLRLPPSHLFDQKDENGGLDPLSLCLRFWGARFSVRRHQNLKADSRGLFTGFFLLGFPRKVAEKFHKKNQRPESTSNLREGLSLTKP